MHVDEDGADGKVGGAEARDLEASVGKAGRFSDFSCVMWL